MYNTHCCSHTANLHFGPRLGGKRNRSRGMRIIRHLPLLLLLAPFFPSTVYGDSSTENLCVYSLYIKTGSIIKAGTDSKISVTLGDARGRSVEFPNIESWGVMGPDYDYFERDNLDIFSGRGPCIASPICRLNLTSDGSGPHHGWYCEYVEITSTGPHKECSKTIFYVDQWLASDAPPYQLSAVLDGCRDLDGLAMSKGRFTVRVPERSVV